MAGLFALHLHLVAVVALPVIVLVGAATFRDARPVRGPVHAAALGAAAIAAVGPYVIAEARTAFGNTRAVLGHLGDATSAGDSGGAVMALVIAADPTRLPESIGLGPLTIIIAGAVMLTAAIRLAPAGALRWLGICAAAGIAGQALFSWWMSRPFAGFHHITLLSPLYAVAPAVLLRKRLVTGIAPLDPERVGCALGGVVLAVLVAAGPPRADRFAERTPWSYARIRAALEALCGGVAVDTEEGPAFAARLTPPYDGVLRYMMRRGMTTCRYQPAGDIVIAASLDAQYPASKTIGGATFYRELVLPPGIARYRRAR